jgi:hypothetical protein
LCLGVFVVNLESKSSQIKDLEHIRTIKHTSYNKILQKF